MNFCFDELKKPVVKNKLTWNMGIYKDGSSDKPEIDLNINKNTEVQLLTVAAVAAAVIFAACLCRKMSRILKC